MSKPACTSVGASVLEYEEEHATHDEHCGESQADENEHKRHRGSLPVGPTGGRPPRLRRKPRAVRLPSWSRAGRGPVDRLSHVRLRVSSKMPLEARSTAHWRSWALRSR